MGFFRRYADKIASHWQYGLPLAAGLAFLPSPHWPAILLATLLLLRTGSSIACGGFLGVLGIAYFSGQAYSFAGFPQSAIPFLVAFLPIGIAAYLLQATRSFSIAVQSYFVMLTAVLGVNFLISGPIDIQNWKAFWECRKALLGTTEVDVLSQIYAMSVDEVLLSLMRVWPVIFFSFQCVILFFARYLQACLYYPGGFRADFHSLRASQWTGIAAAIFIIAMLFTPNVAEYVILLQLGGLGLVFLVLMGLGWAHWYVGFKKKSIWILGLLYAALFILGAWVSIPLAVVGFLDAMMDLRLRMARQ